MNKFANTLLLAILLATAAFGQNKVFEWDGVLCSYKGTYDPAKISLKTIEDTKKLVDFGMGLPLQTEKTAWTPDDIDKLDVKALDSEYKQTLEMLQGLEPADTPFFSELKSKHIETLKQAYVLERATLLAYKDPSGLREFESTQNACYVKWGLPIIAGGDALLSAWKVLLEEQMKRNGAPDALKAKFDQRYASSQRDVWALVEVINFGWWNCVNRSIPYAENDGSAEEAFKALFAKVEMHDCDEP